MSEDATMTESDETTAVNQPTHESAFTALMEQHRRELHIHCYRMLASFDDAEDAVRTRSCAHGGIAKAGGRVRRCARGSIRLPPTPAWT
jgi:hypothetical protein